MLYESGPKTHINTINKNIENVQRGTNLKLTGL